MVGIIPNPERNLHTKEREMKPLLSIIMPVYNQERYLHNSIACVMAQSLAGFELILVDDGSTDSSLHICEEAAAGDQRIRVIHKPNGGVSSARNAGLAAARGTYIGFMDADDGIDKNFYQTLYQIAETEGCDLVSSRYYSASETDLSQKIPDSIWFVEVNRKLDRDQIFSVVLPTMYKGFDCSSWNKIYRKALIDQFHLRFREDLTIGEDYLFVLQYLCHIQTYYYTTYMGYQYILREGSAMHRFHRKYLQNYFNLYREKGRLAKQCGCDAKILEKKNREWLLMIGEDFLTRTDGMQDKEARRLRKQAYIKMVFPLKVRRKIEWMLTPNEK